MTNLRETSLVHGFLILLAEIQSIIVWTRVQPPHESTPKQDTRDLHRMMTVGSTMLDMISIDLIVHRLDHIHRTGTMITRTSQIIAVHHRAILRILQIGNVEATTLLAHRIARRVVIQEQHQG